MLRNVLTIGLLLCLSMSCDENITSPIPYAPVNLILDLDGRDKKLNSSLSYIEYPFAPVLEAEKGKCGYGGVLVINGLGEDIVNLYAYDLACPNEVQHNVKIKPENTGLTATCPKCGAVYKIATGGAPESGSKYWLKRYNVIAERGSATRYRVTN